MSVIRQHETVALIWVALNVQENSPLYFIL